VYRFVYEEEPAAAPYGRAQHGPPPWLVIKMLPGEFLLRDGTPAMIWPLLPTDAGTVRDIFRRMSPESRRCRFLIPIAELSDSMIRYLVDSVDGVHHIALILTVLPPDGEEQPVGIARLLQTLADPATADIGIAVADDWRGRGVGTALVAALMQRRPAAVRRLRTAVAAGNRASLALLAKTGHMSFDPAEPDVLDVTVDLTAPNGNIVGTTSGTVRPATV
jgi:RimJ/RimL family protein N-acetyltransferase